MRSLVSLLFVAFACTFAARADAQELLSKENALARLQGHWKAEKWVIHGKDTSEGRDNRSYRIEDQKMIHVTDGNDVGISRFKIDTTSKPYKLDVTYVGGPRDGQTLLGIFKLENDRFVNCFSYPGDPRPNAFKSTVSNRYFLSIDRKIADEKGEP
ncbi:TIGR03067 domain-containing protein [Rhodopirellula sp. SWK7]|uniref:TIGR03067 domain-containing protein n=1 Tax=Rhodopirellula sp. SWK7 TaxID=595460 RepID=UPI0005C65CA2